MCVITQLILNAAFSHHILFFQIGSIQNVLYNSLEMEIVDCRFECIFTKSCSFHMCILSVVSLKVNTLIS